MWCRATLRQAYRFLWLDDRELVSWDAAQVLAATYPEVEDEYATARMVAQVLGMDELVRDSVLFDRGGLVRYITMCASASLMARMPLVGSWVCARRSVFQLGEVEDDRLVVTDLVTRRQHTLVHLGAAVGLGPHAGVVGRLAPSGVEPEEMFVSRPLHVDESTAVELAEAWREDGGCAPEYAEDRDLEGRLRALLDGGYGARLAAGYCWRWSDPVPGGGLRADVEIGDWHRPWNNKKQSSHGHAPGTPYWASDPAGFEQVGCVYTAQGFEYDYSGVIIGPDLVWRNDQWVPRPEFSHDTQVKRGTAEQFDQAVRNTYKVLLTRGMRGSLVYSTDPQTHDLLRSLTPG